jgi:hypothetical protein
LNEVNQEAERMPEGKGTINEYRMQIDPILEDIEASLDQLSDADVKIAEDLQRAEKEDTPIRPVGGSYLVVFRKLRDEIENSRIQIASLSPPPSLRVFQAIYVKALDVCLESVSQRIKACVYIVEGDEADAEKALRQVHTLTEEFKRIEEEALKNMW